jgi:PAS domain S-box-containing protein
LIKLLSKIKLPRFDGELPGELEQQYRLQTLPSYIRQATGGIIIFLIPAVLLMVNDFIFLGLRPVLYYAIAFRLAFMVYGIVMIFALRRTRDPDSYDLKTLHLGLFGAALIIFLNSTRPAEYFGHYFIDLIILVIIYLGIPSKLTYRFATAMIFTAGCFVLLGALKNSISASNMMVLIFSLIAVNAGGVFFSHRLYSSQRRHFVDGLALQRDLQELKQAEADLRNRNTLLSALINSPKDVTIFSIDTDLRFTAFNDHYFHKMLELWKKEIVVGMYLPDSVTVQDIREKTEAGLRRALRGETLTETEYNSDQKAWYETTMNPVRQENGKIVGVTGFVRDITVPKLAEAAALEAESLKQTNKARSELLANVSHELRTPLASIKGNIETLLADDVEWTKAQQLDFLSSANDEADHLTLLIRNLLDMSRLDSDKINLQKRQYKVQEILDSASSRLKALTRAHILEFDIQPGLPEVNMDKMRIAQVITNLVENAAKFSPEGSPITIGARSQGDRLVISVVDKGVGITEAAREKLFNRFYQAENVVCGKTRGTGLGLSICKGIIEAHGGSIWVESTAGLGSVFSFNLPFSPA